MDGLSIAPESQKASARLLHFLKGSPNPRAAEFAGRLAIFAFARAVVFTLAGGSVIWVISQGSGVHVGYSFKGALFIVIFSYLSSALQWWAARRKFQLYPVALGLLFFDQLLVAATAYLTGGVSSGATSLFGVTCLVGALLLGVPGVLIAALSGGVFFSLIVLMTQGAGGLHPPDQALELYVLSSSQTAYYFVFNLLMLLLVALLTSYLSERLQRAGGEVRAAHRRADRAERLAALGRLSAGLAHEIRNPLSSISGSVQMLRSSAERDEDKELCDIVLSESKRLDDLVSDMLNLSSTRKPTFESTDVGLLTRDIVALANQSGRGGGDVVVRYIGPPSVHITADVAQLKQLIWNLVRNAIQASSAGEEVRVRLEADERAELRVEDDGIGIDENAQSSLFDAFFTTRSHGTGLGLAVVKRIADDHGFDLRVESEYGQGAHFIIDLGQVGRDDTLDPN